MAEKIMTLHPDPGKSGVNISKAKYDQINNAIIDSIRSVGVLTFNELNVAVEQHLGDSFQG